MPYYQKDSADSKNDYLSLSAMNANSENNQPHSFLTSLRSSFNFLVHYWYKGYSIIPWEFLLYSFIIREQKTSYSKLQGEAIPLDDSAQPTLNKINFIEYFGLGVRQITDNLWPLGLLALSGRDLFYFHSHEAERYGDSYIKLLAGMSNSEWPISNNLGTSLVAETRFWIAPAILLSLPVLNGLFQYVANRSQVDCNIPDDYRYWNNPIVLSQPINWVQDIVAFLNPYSKMRRNLQEAVFLRLWRNTFLREQIKWEKLNLEIKINEARRFLRFRPSIEKEVKSNNVVASPRSLSSLSDTYDMDNPKPPSLHLPVLQNEENDPESPRDISINSYLLNTPNIELAENPSKIYEVQITKEEFEIKKSDALKQYYENGKIDSLHNLPNEFKFNKPEEELSFKMDFKWMEIEKESKDPLVSTIETFLNGSHTRWMKIPALGALRKIAAAFKQEDLNHYADYDAFTRDRLIQASKQAKSILEKERGHWRELPLYILHQNELFKLGQSYNNWLLPLFILPLGYSLYAYMRYWMVLSLKALKLYEYERDKNDCENENKQWSYLDSVGNYACTVCGDWPFIPSPYFNDAEECLNFLLRYPRNTETLLAALQQVSQHLNVTFLDLSSQLLDQWKLADWSAVLNLLETAKFAGLQFLNISQSTVSSTPYLPEIVTLIQDFLQSRPLRNIDMHNQPFVPTILANTLPATVDTLDVSNVDLTNQGAVFLSQRNRQFPLKQLSMRNTQIADLGIQQLVASFNHSRFLRYWDIANNPLTQSSTVPLAYSLQNNTALEVLNLSGMTLSESTTFQLGIALGTNQLQQLIASHANLEDQDLVNLTAYLSRANLQQLDISYNYINGDGIDIWGPALANSRLGELNLANNLLYDDSLTELGKYLSLSQLHNLDLSNNDFSDAVLAQFISHLPPSMQTLRLSNTGVGSLTVKAIADFATRNVLLEVDLSNNQLIDSVVLQVVNQFSNTSLRHLNIAGNQFTLIASTALANWAKQGNLTTLNLADVALTPAMLTPLIKVLPTTALTSLNLNNNPLPGIAIQLAEQLIHHEPLLEPLTEFLTNTDEQRLLAASRPTTNLQQLSLVNTQTDTAGAIALCQAIRPTLISPATINLVHNEIDASQLSEHGCEFLPTTVTRIARSTARFFAEAKQPAVRYALAAGFFNQTKSAIHKLAIAQSESQNFTADMDFDVYSPQFLSRCLMGMSLVVVLLFLLNKCCKAIKPSTPSMNMH